VLLVIDIGTSNFKAALFNNDGFYKNEVSLPLNMARPAETSAAATAPTAGSAPPEAGRHEADPALWLRAFSEAVSRLGSLADVEGVVISGNGPTVVPVTGEPSLTGGSFWHPPPLPGSGWTAAPRTRRRPFRPTWGPMWTRAFSSPKCWPSKTRSLNFTTG
jgi:hypothetical protein